MRTLLLFRGGMNNYANLTRGTAMRSPILAIACGFGLVAASAALADQTQAPVAQPISAVQDPNPVTCRTLVHEGRVIRANECHTKHEWEAMRLRSQQDFREFQVRSLTSSP
jgi:hypothetical protein